MILAWIACGVVPLAALTALMLRAGLGTPPPLTFLGAAIGGPLTWVGAWFGDWMSRR